MRILYRAIFFAVLAKNSYKFFSLQVLLFNLFGDFFEAPFVQLSRDCRERCLQRCKSVRKFSFLLKQFPRDIKVVTLGPMGEIVGKIPSLRDFPAYMLAAGSFRLRATLARPFAASDRAKPLTFSAKKFLRSEGSRLALISSVTLTASV